MLTREQLNDVNFQLRCRNDFVYFCEKVLDLEMTDYHQEIASLPMSHRYLCILVPRGHSKTSLFSIAYPLWRLFREKDIEICLVSSSLDQSGKIFSKVQYILETNPFFSSLLPTDRFTAWNKSLVTTSNHNLYYVKPFTSSGRGMQPHYAIYDDLLRDVDNMFEAKDLFWSVFFLAGQANACQHIICGTPISLDDLYAEIENHPTKKKSWLLCKKRAVKEDKDGNWIEPLWETRFPLDKLMEIKDSIGAYRFEREMMCRPTAVGESLYPTDLVLNCLDYNLEFSDEVKGVPLIGADFAMSERASGDFNAFIVVDNAVGESYLKKTDKGMVEISNPVFIRHITQYKGSVGQIDRIKRLHEKYKGARIVGDESGVGAKFIRELRESYFSVDGQDFQPAKRNMILLNLRTLIEKNRLVIPAGDMSSPLTNILLRELSGFRLIENKNTGHQSWKSNLDHDDCLKEGTLIRVANGYKPIEEIKIGDLVLTHRNRFRKVVNLIKKPFRGDFYSIRFNGNLSLDLSYNHPIYVAPFKFRKDEGTTYRVRKWILPEKWKKAYRSVSLKERFGKNKLRIFKEEDFYKNSKYAKSIKLKSICLDKSFAEFLGRFLADGHCVKNPKKSVYPLSLAFNSDDLDGVFKFSRYLREKKVACGLIANSKNGVSLGFNSKLLWHIMSLCYNKKREKALPPFYKELGTDLRYVLEQWLAGDGWFNPKRKEIIGVSTSKALALGMHDIAWSLGKYALIQKCKRHRYEKKSKDQYWVTIKGLQVRKNYLGPGISTHGTKKMLTSFEFGSYAKTIQKYYFSGSVYNLQVEEDESFVADGFVVHNCVMALAMAVKDITIPRKVMKDLIYGA